jgi:O-antigen/teichoic acid export membrane protein
MVNTKQRVFNGVFWSGIKNYSGQAIQFVISILMARILSPSDYGLIGLVMVVVAILQTINESGFLEALLHKLDRDELDYSSVFVANIFLGLLLYSILYLLAPSIAVFFARPELISLTRILGLNLIITSFVVVQRSILFIKVDFKSQAIASVIATIISGTIGLYCVYTGQGVMSLVYQSLSSNLVNTICLWIFAKTTPKILFSFHRFLALFKIADKVIASNIINSVFEQGYSAIIGKFYSPADLGFFSRAKGFQSLTSGAITGIIQPVSSPILSEAQNDFEQLKSHLKKFIVYTALIVYPLLTGLMVLAKPLIVVLLTEKWLPAVFMLQILCPVGFLYIISTFNNNVFIATGRTDWGLVAMIIKKSLFVVIVACAVVIGKNNILLLLLSQPLTAMTDLLVSSYYSRKQIGITLWEQLYALKDVFSASLLMGVIIIVFTIFIKSYLITLVVGFVVGVTSYSILCWIFNIADFKTLVKKRFSIIKPKFLNH